MSWWKTATEEEKLRQLIAGRELGMTFNQIAMNCRTTQRAIESFCARRGIKIENVHISTNNYSKASKRRVLDGFRDRGYSNQDIEVYATEKGWVL